RTLLHAALRRPTLPIGRDPLRRDPAAVPSRSLAARAAAVRSADSPGDPFVAPGDRDLRERPRRSGCRLPRAAGVVRRHTTGRRPALPPPTCGCDRGRAREVRPARTLHPYAIIEQTA